MYCVRCGAQLSDTEQHCPLCQTKVFHPDIVRGSGEALYPKSVVSSDRGRSYWPQAVLTALFLLPVVIVLLCDLQFNNGITWSGFVIGALFVGYVSVILPTWFQTPNPVIFVPCAFVAVGLYLLYISLVTAGGWFLSFAFPVVGGVALIVTTMVTLLRYVRRGKLYIFGGAFVALGAFMLLVEFLMTVTFPGYVFVGWSLYPLAGLILLGAFLIFLGICRPARETMERKLFI